MQGGSGRPAFFVHYGRDELPLVRATHKGKKSDERELVPTVNRNFCCIFIIPHPLYVVVSGDRFICAVRSAAIWKIK